MKNLLIILSFVFISQMAQAQNKSLKDEKVFEVKSGVVEYQLDGMTKGTKTLWFDDYGRLQCTHTTTTTKLMGITNKEEKLEIRNHQWVYTINLMDKTGTKSKIESAMAPTDAMYSGLSEEEKAQFVENVKKSFNAREVGTGEVIGKTCVITEIGSGNKVWGYKNITLKSEIGSGMMKSSEVATKFTENASVPASKFQPPAGIEIQDVTDMMNNLPGMPGMDDEEEE
ncbi:MAG: hypothetical protein PHQ65_17630 [Bacteroidales bacterium]|nr:hypothetical protein [Bacteroidales bacterium]MDD3667084.1 hypothetical protein [Bacteroidales bacterium]